MKKTLFTLAMIASAICSYAQNEQERSIKMPEVPKQHKFTEFSLKDKGYWWSADISIGPSLTFHEKNLLTTGVNFVNGYRFNDYLTITDFTLHFSCCFTKLLHSLFITLLNNFTM